MFKGIQYSPQVNDIVIGVIVSKNFEQYTVDINSEAFALLGTMEFNNATKQNKPNLEEGTLIYCRVVKVDKYAKTLLSCISPVHKQAWNSGEAFFGPLIGGFVKDFPISFCRNILSQKDHYLLSKLGLKFKFNINIGYNGKVWVFSKRTTDVIFIMNGLEKLVEFGDTKESADFIMQSLIQ